MARFLTAFLVVSISLIAYQVHYILKLTEEHTEKSSIVVPYKVVESIVVEIAPTPAELVTRNTSLDYIDNSVDIISISKLTISKQELTCLATNLYHEARGESDRGMIAVAHVTLNRVNSSRYPDTICGVVHQAVHSKWWYEQHGRLVPVRNMCQFSWYCDGRSDSVDTFSDGWKNSVYIAMAVLVKKYEDPTYGADHYFNHNLVRPKWSYTYARTAKIENHTFHTSY